MKFSTAVASVSHDLATTSISYAANVATDVLNIQSDVPQNTQSSIVSDDVEPERKFFQ